MGLFLGYFSKRLLVGLAGKGAQGAIFIGRGAIKVIGICSIEGGRVVFYPRKIVDPRQSRSFWF